MIAYHGSNKVIDNPNLTEGRIDTDFGQGFYLTLDETMAKKWAGRKNPSIVNEYELITRGLTILKLDLDQTWLDFVVANRNMYLPNAIPSCDIIIGPTADDKLFSTIELYESNSINAETAVRALNCMEVGQQVCLKTEKALSQLNFVKSKSLSENERDLIRKIIKDDKQRAAQLTKEILQENNKLMYNPFDKLQDLIFVDNGENEIEKNKDERDLE